ncbi:hypothetical protein BKA70DRAFT_1435793 [Coprinopsis sp. MPI-PUGE-AT-0042]|nr:hypothetical protein BKA70DRAFT_1435793 [Coprinopsis sp. MPI-PUGE-AT-0042]
MREPLWFTYKKTPVHTPWIFGGSPLPSVARSPSLNDPYMQLQRLRPHHQPPTTCYVAPRDTTPIRFPTPLPATASVVDVFLATVPLNRQPSPDDDPNNWPIPAIIKQEGEITELDQPQYQPAIGHSSNPVNVNDPLAPCNDTTPGTRYSPIIIPEGDHHWGIICPPIQLSQSTLADLLDTTSTQDKQLRSRALSNSPSATQWHEGDEASVVPSVSGIPQAERTYSMFTPSSLAPTDHRNIIQRSNGLTINGGMYANGDASTTIQYNLLVINVDSSPSLVSTISVITVETI